MILMRKQGFSLIELMVAMVILAILTTAGVGSFMTSQQKSRDSRRKGDLRQIATSLEAYANDHGSYPVGVGGDIQGCGNDAVESCTWGEPMSNTATDPHTIYMPQLPKDPNTSRQYYYESSDGSYFRLYTVLDNDQDVLIEPAVITDCGVGAENVDCNYGISSANIQP